MIARFAYEVGHCGICPKKIGNKAYISLFGSLHDTIEQFEIILFVLYV